MKDRTRIALAERACEEIQDGDSIFLGSGQTCCYLAKLLERFHNLSIVTNNITALSDLLKTDSRVYLLGGEVTSTDAHTLFSSPENPSTFTNHVFVSKAFTSISGIDLQAGLTVHSIVSTHIYRNLPSIARSWYLMADHLNLVRSPCILSQSLMRFNILSPTMYQKITVLFFVKVIRKFF